MASCTTTPLGSSTSPRLKLTVTQSASTATTDTLSWTLQYLNSATVNTNNDRSYTVKIAGTTVKSGTYDIDGVTGTKTIASGTKTITKTTATQTISFSCSMAFNITWSGTYIGTRSASGSISVAAKTSYKVTYNANGGSGAPSSQTKWYGTNLTLSSTKPTRTGYTFQGWATSSSGSVAYAAGATYSANAAVTLYAVWKAITYTVSYNANGGSGAPGNQTKTHGVNLTLSSTKPTRTNYNFKGWGTSASATTVSYAAGTTYSTNAAITLYAIWELAYVKPRITSYSVARCSDTNGTLSDEGKYALVKFIWATDKTVSSITIQWKLTTDSSYSSSNKVTVSASGTSGTVSQAVGAGAISTDNSYNILVTVTDSGGSTSNTKTLAGLAFTIDGLAGGNGVAFGKPAELSGYADVNYKARFRKIIESDITTSTYLNGNKGGAIINSLAAAGFNMLYRLKSTKGVFMGGAHNDGLYAYYTADSVISAGTNATTKTVKILDESGNSSFPGTVGIAGNANISSSATISGKATVSGTITGNGNIYAKSAFIVPNESTAGVSASKGYCGYTSSGGLVRIATVSSSNNVVIGADGGTNPGNTNIYGKGVTLAADDGTNSAKIYLSPTSGTYNGYFYPTTTNKTTLGTSSNRWYRVYSANSCDTSSDERLKSNIIPMNSDLATFLSGDSSNIFENIFLDLKPVSYSLNIEDGTTNEGKMHFGFIAQDVSKTLEENGLSEKFTSFISHEYWTDEETGEEKDEYGLTYEEFIPLNTYMIQKAYTKLNEQQKEIDDLKSEVAELKDLVQQLLDKSA